MLDHRHPFDTTGPLLMALCFLAYWASFKLNGWLLPWFDYLPGVSLVFLPAGVKLVSMLVAGVWGVLGVGLAGLWMAAGVWQDAQWLPLLGNIVVWLGVPYLVLVLLMRVLGVARDLSNLRYLTLLFMAVVAILVQSLASNLYAMLAHGRSAAELLPATLAMAVGDVVGAGIVLSLMMLALTLWRGVGK